MKSVSKVELEALRSSDLFDEKWYLEQYPDVKTLGMDPGEHYLWLGKKLGRTPSRGVKHPERIWNPNDPAKPTPAMDKILGAYEYCSEYASMHNGSAWVVPECDQDITCQLTKRLAVHLHLFHTDMASQFIRYLKNIPVPFDLFISLPKCSDENAIVQLFSEIANATEITAEIHANRGRDLAPMFAGFGSRLANYDYIAHIHSKRSEHTQNKRDWCTHLLHHLFHSKDHVSQILNKLDSDCNIGLLFPVYHPSVKGQISWGANLATARQLAERLRIDLAETDLQPFPAGSFFIARRQALMPFFNANLATSDFDQESGQIDGTLAHAIERMLAIVAHKSGFECLQVRAEKPHSLSTSFTGQSRYTSDVLDNIKAGKTSVVPSSSTLKDSVKVAFFTCSTGGYDEPLPYEHLVNGADYYFFTDQEYSDGSFWKIESTRYAHSSNRIKTARYHKSQAHKLLSDYDIAVWVDANVSIVGDVSSLIQKVIDLNICFGVIPHPYRNSYIEEAEVIVRLGIDGKSVVSRQVEQYQSEGYSGQNGLTETNFLIMNLAKEETAEALDIWWHQIERHSHRDQLSFDYSMWKAGARSVALLENGLSLRADWRFTYFEHGKGRHPYAELLPAITPNGKSLGIGAPAHRSKSADVVICIHNSPEDVERCLNSLVRSRDTRTRLILIDDGSDAPTRKVVDKHCQNHPSDILIRHEAARGYTRAANVGLKTSTSDYVILLNSDTVVPFGWVDALIEAGETDNTIGILGPLSNAASWQSVPQVFDSAGDFAVNELPVGVTVDDATALCASISKELVYRTPVINGFCFAIKREVIDTIGFLDEVAFPQGYGEENDFCFRAVDAGWSCGLVTHTYVFHAKSKSFTHERRRKLSAEGFNALVKKHSTKRIEAAVNFMRSHSALAAARDDFARAIAKRCGSVKPICFYLPQFHPFDVNDRAWGEGFTEWTNVVKAQPLFPGHVQPKLPGKLGFYDLRLRDTLKAQAELAAQHGIFGFAIYYYRFGSERPMWRPIEVLLDNPDIPLNFCFCWANEDWTRAWDGKTKDIILKQDYSEQTIGSIIDDLVDSASDDRYIKIDGSPLFLIYQINKLPNLENTLHRFRDEFQRRTGTRLIIGTTYNDAFRPEWEELVDLIIQFPPHRTPRVSKRGLVRPEQIMAFRPERQDYFEDYEQVMTQSLEVADYFGKLHPGVCPDWDNSPRRPKNANVLVGSSPDKFGAWVTRASEAVRQKYIEGKILAPFLFVNAWNEWAEGAFLEPSQAHGDEYLRSLSENIR